MSLIVISYSLYFVSVFISSAVQTTSLTLKTSHQGGAGNFCYCSRQHRKTKATSILVTLIVFTQQLRRSNLSDSVLINVFF